MKSKVLATFNDVRGRPVVEFYSSTYRRKPCVRFRVIGGNGEKQAPSQPYPDLSNAKRGANDLYLRLEQAYGQRAFAS